MMTSHCSTCRQARAIVKANIKDWIMLLFAGDSEQERRAMYLHNIVNTYEMYKAGDIPFEWLGFVHWKTCIEYNSYFPGSPTLDHYITHEIAKTVSGYIQDENDGKLFAVLQKKFGGQ